METCSSLSSQNLTIFFFFVMNNTAWDISVSTVDSIRDITSERVLSS
jgi:hypothetical protein